MVHPIVMGEPPSSPPTVTNMMKPYFETELGELYCGNCIDIMEEIHTNSIDLIFADSPFNIGKKYTDIKDSRADYYSWLGIWIRRCFKLLKDTGSFYNMTMEKHIWYIAYIMQKYGVFINNVKWRNCSSSHSKRSFWSSCQPILIYGKTEKYIFNTYAQTRTIEERNLRWGGYSTEPRGQLLDYWDDIPFIYAGSVHHPEAIIKKGTNKKAHPCQMPEGLPKRAMLFSTEKGGIVLDPFMGSGTTAVACEKLNRRWIGIELSEEYCEIAKRRIQKEADQLKFDYEKSL